MLSRLVTAELRQRLGSVPAVALVGPRQSGKTTLARSQGGVYFDLEQEPERLRLDLEWAKVAAGEELVVLDEAQAWPEVFPRLRGAIDRDRRRKGRFLLLGSVSPRLMTEVSESLAGRLSILELHPLLRSELGDRASLDEHWLVGGFPDGGILDPAAFPRWQRDYLSLLVARDLPNWGLPARPQVTDRLLAMLAADHGQVWNASRLGRSLGLSYHTVNQYLDYLVGAFLLRRLRPFAANIGKRLTKSPKVFWRDSGLLHSLLNVPDWEALLRRPDVGASWEGFVIEQVLGHLHARGRVFDVFFLRTASGREIDLILELGGERWAIEVKLTASPTPTDLRRLDEDADLIGADRRYLVSRVAESHGEERRASLPLDGLLALL